MNVLERKSPPIPSFHVTGQIRVAEIPAEVKHFSRPTANTPAHVAYMQLALL
jgi:hypothetical protein